MALPGPDVARMLYALLNTAAFIPVAEGDDTAQSVTLQEQFSIAAAVGAASGKVVQLRAGVTFTAPSGAYHRNTDDLEACSRL